MACVAFSALQSASTSRPRPQGAAVPAPLAHHHAYRSLTLRGHPQHPAQGRQFGVGAAREQVIATVEQPALLVFGHGVEGLTLRRGEVGLGTSDARPTRTRPAHTRAGATDSEFNIGPDARTSAGPHPGTGIDPVRASDRGGCIDIDTIADIRTDTRIHAIGAAQGRIHIGEATPSDIRACVHAVATADRSPDSEAVAGIDADADATYRHSRFLRTRRPESRQEQASGDEKHASPNIHGHSSIRDPQPSRACTEPPLHGEGFPGALRFAVIINAGSLSDGLLCRKHAEASELPATSSLAQQRAPMIEAIPYLPCPVGGIGRRA
ncbi:protein of unknown function [Pseudorhizobium banfieldiae]|uniref:Uncharacterized protein n=1 Tax=Pseudorhizobium banfieldiae TaxID=1125847 RepID=L0NJ50_9HYPH|nr:protein of unknown function [Pseudorhizobium banfieldiae]